MNNQRKQLAHDDIYRVGNWIRDKDTNGLTVKQIAAQLYEATGLDTTLTEIKVACEANHKSYASDNTLRGQAAVNNYTDKRLKELESLKPMMQKVQDELYALKKNLGVA